MHNVAVRTGLVFADRDTGPLVLDLYLPPPSKASGAPPVVAWLHGGGWFTGDRHLAPDLRRYFASRGIAMASIEYRLSGHALFPAQLHDVRAAVRYLRRNAAGLGIDGGSIGLWGSSAGGHLAALAGVTGHLETLAGEPDIGPEPDASVSAVAEGYGPVDLLTAATESDLAALALADADRPETRLLGGSPSQLPDQARAASPLSFVTAAAPPFLIVHGTADPAVRPSQSALLHNALAAAGVESTLYLIDGFGHGFLNRQSVSEFPGATSAGADTPPRPTFLQEGRLEREPHPPAVCHRIAPGQTPSSHQAAFSYDVVGDFFRRHLLGR
ncbi:alpha/beta hydrolase [Nocardiopsis gilva YIM 90087]|uniref:Alpha/beta hydrolase n=1 Tax=Nocardiopsis gilva YIM 90087 TaxID=1235441 RepID=A0A223SCC4_9ACTN|nr:alpha/beta hydrolase [Nocardiopsis gilva]ASU85814.1 alpha/beta hydrolase [Nocardiopsis gilva YIM 90087]